MSRHVVVEILLILCAIFGCDMSDRKPHGAHYKWTVIFARITAVTLTAWFVSIEIPWLQLTTICQDGCLLSLR